MILAPTLYALADDTNQRTVPTTVPDQELNYTNFSTLPRPLKGAYFERMNLAPRAWHIIAETEREGRDPSREYFVVAIDQEHRALQSLRMRKNVSDAKLVVVGEATQDFIVTSNIREGEIHSVALSS